MQCDAGHIVRLQAGVEDPLIRALFLPPWPLSTFFAHIAKADTEREKERMRERRTGGLDCILLPRVESHAPTARNVTENRPIFHITHTTLLGETLCTIIYSEKWGYQFLNP